MNEPGLRRLPRSRLVGLVFLLVLWGVFAVWQWTEYVHQSKLIQDSLSSQAESLSTAVDGGVRSHRWFGPFVQEQLPETLGVLARSKDVVAIALVVNDETDTAFIAGDEERIDFSLPVGEHSRDDVIQVVSSFSMQNKPPGMRAGSYRLEKLFETNDLRSIIVMDRTATITQIHREARNRLLVFVLGTLLLLAASAVWLFTVRLAQSEGTTRVLKAETRHLRELGQAAAGLAHETRNPLGLIRGWTQRLVDTGLPNEDQQGQAEAVLEECDRVTARINQFLAFARQAEVNMESVDVESILQELGMLLQSDLNAKGLTLETILVHRPSAVRADRDQFRQTLFNLLQNATAFAPEDSKITVSLSNSSRDTFRLEVADQGPGVSEEIVDSLFEPYVTKRPGGTGLGLSIVRRIAVAHEWDVGYRSGNNGGAVFWIDRIRGM